MNFFRILKNTDIIEVSYYMGFDGETPNTVLMTVEEALPIADEENHGHCHDGYAVFHIDQYELGCIVEEEDNADRTIKAFTVSHLAPVIKL